MTDVLTIALPKGRLLEPSAALFRHLENRGNFFQFSKPGKVHGAQVMDGSLIQAQYGLYIFLPERPDRYFVHFRHRPLPILILRRIKKR